jgi:hypothetical protein
MKTSKIQLHRGWKAGSQAGIVAQTSTTKHFVPSCFKSYSQQEFLDYFVLGKHEDY